MEPVAVYSVLRTPRRLVRSKAMLDPRLIAADEAGPHRRLHRRAALELLPHLRPRARGQQKHGSVVVLLTQTRPEDHEVLGAIPQRGEVRVDRTIEIDRHEPPPQKPLHLAREEPKPAIARRVVAALGRWDISVVVPNWDYLDARIDPLRVVGDADKPMRVRVVARHHPPQHVHVFRLVGRAERERRLPLHADNGFREHASFNKKRPARPVSIACTPFMASRCARHVAAGPALIKTTSGSCSSISASI